MSFKVLEVLDSRQEDVDKYRKIQTLQLSEDELQLAIESELINDMHEDWLVVLKVMLLECKLESNNLAHLEELVGQLTEITLLMNFNLGTAGAGATSGTNSGSTTSVAAAAVTTTTTNPAAGTSSGTSADLKLIVKCKLNDLMTDYQYLVNVKNHNYKIIELINKKIILLNNISHYNNCTFMNHIVKVPLIVKIIELLVISEYDFRRLDLFTFINDNFLVPESIELTPDTRNLFFVYIINKEIVTWPMLQQFLENCHCRLLSRLHVYTLVENLVQNDLHILSRFYKSVYLSNLPLLFNLTDEFTINPLMISNMIINNNLPSGTKIDQVNGILVFPTQVVNSFNDTLKFVNLVSNKV